MRLFHLFLFLLCLGLFSDVSFAQGNGSDEPVPIDKDLTTPKKPEPPQPKTIEDLANVYYKKCVARDNKAFIKSEKETLCGCTAAKMTEMLTFKEISLLETEDPLGQNGGQMARKKFLTLIYVPCMPYATKHFTKSDCYSNQRIKKVPIGKVAVCKCVSDELTSYVDRLSPTIIYDSAIKNPMSLDPLEEYFISEGYNITRNRIIEGCIYNLSYEKQNYKKQSYK